MSKFSIGSDPEFMVWRDGYRSAIGIVPGTKDERYYLGAAAFYYDNVLAECTIPPASSREEFIENIRTTLKAYEKLMGKGYQLACCASHEFKQTDLKHPDALKIGCDPEWCAYELIESPPSTKVAQIDRSGKWHFLPSFRRRSCGGHIHIGCDVAKDYIGRLSIVRMMDLFVGIPAVLIDKDPTALARKQLYGWAGRYRQPHHGTEYRTLSNFWFASPFRAGLIYDLCDFVVDFVENEQHNSLWAIDIETLMSDKVNDPDFKYPSCHKCIGYDANAVRHAIDKMDKQTARELMPFIEKFLPSALNRRINDAIADHPEVFPRSEWSL